MRREVRYVVYADSADSRGRQRTYRMSPEFATEGEAKDYIGSLVGAFADDPALYVVPLSARAAVMEKGFLRPV